MVDEDLSHVHPCLSNVHIGNYSLPTCVNLSHLLPHFFLIYLLTCLCDFLPLWIPCFTFLVFIISRLCFCMLKHFFLFIPLFKLVFTQFRWCGCWWCFGRLGRAIHPKKPDESSLIEDRVLVKHFRGMTILCLIVHAHTRQHTYTNLFTSSASVTVCK